MHPGACAAPSDRVLRRVRSAVENAAVRTTRQAEAAKPLRPQRRRGGRLKPHLPRERQRARQSRPSQGEPNRAMQCLSSSWSFASGSALGRGGRHGHRPSSTTWRQARPQAQQPSRRQTPRPCGRTCRGQRRKLWPGRRVATGTWIQKTVSRAHQASEHGLSTAARGTCPQGCQAAAADSGGLPAVCARCTSPGAHS